MEEASSDEAPSVLVVTDTSADDKEKDSSVDAAAAGLGRPRQRMSTRKKGRIKFLLFVAKAGIRHLNHAFIRCPSICSLIPESKNPPAPPALDSRLQGCRLIKQFNFYVIPAISRRESSLGTDAFIVRRYLC